MDSLSQNNQKHIYYRCYCQHILVLLQTLPVAFRTCECIWFDILSVSSSAKLLTSVVTALSLFARLDSSTGLIRSLMPITTKFVPIKDK